MGSALCATERAGLAADFGRSIWPPRFDLFGVPLSCTDYEEAVARILLAADARRPALVTAFAAHGVVTASEDLDFLEQIRDFDLVAPDGQPVRMALNLLHGVGMRDRVYGPELMLRLCEQAAEVHRGIYLYGSTPHTVAALRAALVRRFPDIDVVGCEPSVFRPLTPEEDRELIDRIARSGAQIVFVGLGCPRQEIFAHAHRNSIQAVQVCVGAAFDFVAGTKRIAPRWMQDHALEWLFRLSQEPRRLSKRYTIDNSKFLAKLMLQLAGKLGERDRRRSGS